MPNLLNNASKISASIYLRVGPSFDDKTLRGNIAMTCRSRLRHVHVHTQQVHVHGDSPNKKMKKVRCPPFHLKNGENTGQKRLGT